MLKEDLRVDGGLAEKFATPPHHDRLLIFTDGGTIDAVNACDIIASDGSGRFLIKHSESMVLGGIYSDEYFRPQHHDRALQRQIRHV
jgi:hypothetical protein